MAEGSFTSNNGPTSPGGASLSAAKINSPSPIDSAIQALRSEVGILNDILGIHATKLEPILGPIEEKENPDNMKTPRHPVSVVAAIHDITYDVMHLRTAVAKLTNRVAL